jgi:hypothetical protein
MGLARPRPREEEYVDDRNGQGQPHERRKPSAPPQGAAPGHQARHRESAHGRCRRPAGGEECGRLARGTETYRTALLLFLRSKHFTGTDMLPGHQNRGHHWLGPRDGLYATPDAPNWSWDRVCGRGSRLRDHACGTPLGREGSKGCAGGRELPRPGPGADPPAGPGAGPPSKAHAVLERPRGPRLGGAAGSSCAGRVQERPRIDGAKFQGWPNSRDYLVNGVVDLWSTTFADLRCAYGLTDPCP